VIYSGRTWGGRVSSVRARAHTRVAEVAFTGGGYHKEPIGCS